MAKNLYSMTTDELRTLAGQNSADWHGADKATQDALHAQNVAIHEILDARTGSSSSFDSGTGRWSVQAGAQPSADALAREYRRMSASFGADAYAQQLAAQRAAVEKAVGALEDSRRDTQEQYAALFRQLYLDRMRDRKNLDQQLAASGVTGGAAETTRLGYDTAYADALRQGEQSRIRAVDTIDRAIADARLTGDIEGANAARAIREDTDAYADALRYLIDRQDAIDARQESYEREDAAAARRYAEEQRKAAEAAEREEREAKKPILTAAQVNAALKAGIRTEAVLAAYDYYYGQK